MPMVHRAFLLEYERFRQSITPLIQAVDQGNYKPLYIQAEQIITSMPPEAWLLHEQGTVLEHIDPTNGVDSGVIGYWLLVILSTFLHPAPSLTHWGILRKALPAVGWSEDDIGLLIRGLSTVSLLKPEINAIPGSVLQTSDPYWYWMIPMQSNQRGWLPVPQIHRLKHHLLSVQDAVIAMPQKVLDVSEDSVSKELVDNIVDLYTSYQEAVAMLEAAEKAGHGLFLIIS